MNNSGFRMKTEVKWWERSTFCGQSILYTCPPYGFTANQCTNYKVQGLTANHTRPIARVVPREAKLSRSPQRNQSGANRGVSDIHLPPIQMPY